MYGNSKNKHSSQIGASLGEELEPEDGGGDEADQECQHQSPQRRKTIMMTMTMMMVVMMMMMMMGQIKSVNINLRNDVRQ